MQIRKARLADAAKLTEMFLEFNDFEEALDPEFKALDKSHVKVFGKHVKTGIDGKNNKFILVAEKEGKIVGLIYCREKKRLKVFKVKRIGYVNDLFILPKFRNKRVAKALMKAAEKEFKKRKIEYICLTSLSNNKNALKAYKKLGFKEFKKEMRKKSL